MFAQVFLLIAVELHRKWFAGLKIFEVSIKCLAFRKGNEEFVFIDAKLKCFSHLGGVRQMLKSELVEVVHNIRNLF